MFKFVDCMKNNKDSSVIHTNSIEHIFKEVKNKNGKSHYAEKLGIKFHINDEEPFFVKPYFDIDIKYIENLKEAFSILKDKENYINI